MTNNKILKKKKVKRLFIILVVILIIIFCGLFYLYQSRKYMCSLNNDKCITLWGTAEGTYIIPDKYTSWFKPTKNYIEVDSKNTIIIIVDRKSKYDYIIFNTYYGKMNIVMPDYKVKYYNYDLRDEFYHRYYTNNKLNEGVDFFSIEFNSYR